LASVYITAGLGLILMAPNAARLLKYVEKYIGPKPRLNRRIGQAINRLRDRGLIERVNTEKGMALRLTPKGARLAETIEEEEKQKVEANTEIVPLIPDKSGHLFVNVVLNGSVTASLGVDTGAPFILLTANLARRLGFDGDNIGRTTEVMVLNGKHKVGQVVLKSVKLGDAEERDVMANVLLEENKEIEESCKDGLLGLSFLSRFHFAIDKKNDKLILKKTE